MIKRLVDLYNGETYGLLGYSMGCISALEVLKRINHLDISRPRHIFLAAHEPRTQTEWLNSINDVNDKWVIDRTIKYGNVPEKLWKNKTFLRMYLPLFRADYSMIAKYNFEQLDLKSDINTSVFYSETDTPRKEMQLWSKFFPCDYYEYSGTHFFIREYHAQIAEVIKNKMGVIDGT